jgi:hypothetical protein
MVGKDIPYMFVPENKIDYVTNWVDQHVPGKKKPAVVSIEQFNSLI